ncbi:hypothetical protein IAU60_003001 [Kwoniella sp. DSM 27419]
MSVRALLRSHAGYNPISLPTSSRPQFVNQEGYEYDPDTEAEHVPEGTPPIDDAVEGEAQAGLSEGVEVDEDVEMEDPEEEEQVGDEAEVAVEEDETAAPLLSIRESLVLPYSLTQTRHHHLTSLFPHVFSHPPVPSHSRPRPRPPPKGVFQFPTPPPTTAALPTNEYHGPLKAPPLVSLQSSPGPEGQAESSKSAGGDGPQTSAATPSGKRPARPKKLPHPDEVEPPAHEIECISRCTLSVGPVSFSGVEIWIGRFVEPRLTMPKKERAKPGERKEKRKSLAEESAARRAARPKPVASPGAAARPSPGYRPRLAMASTPSGGSMPSRPPIPAYARPPTYRPPPGIPRPPAPGAPPARPTASPQLIQLVNQAASRAPWLSALIYKAAGSTANQEELERLGKAVARLSRGEPIEDLAPPGAAPGATLGVRPGPLPAAIAPRPPAPMNPTVRPSTTGAAANPAPRPPSSAPAVRPSLPAAPASTPASAPDPAVVPAQRSAPMPQPVPGANVGSSGDKADDPDFDDEVDMKGPKQVGGGPLPPQSDQVKAGPNASNSQAVPAPGLTPVGVITPASVPLANSASSTDTSLSSKPPAPVTTHNGPIATGPSIASTRPSASPQAQAVLTPQAARPSIPAAATPPPALTQPSRPSYPLPPPFILIAFKEQPTEKYLLPLGRSSFISRVGGDYVTGPAPPEPPQAVILPEPPVKAEAEGMGDPVQAVSVAPTLPAQDPARPDQKDAPSAETSKLPQLPVQGGKPLRSRTRQSLGRGAKEVPIIAATPPPPPFKPEAVEPVPQAEAAISPEPVKKPRPTSGLPPLPGMAPSPGTILISTCVPSGEERWEKIDWEVLRKRLPYDNPELWDDSVKTAVPVKEEAQVVPSVSTEQPAKHTTPGRGSRHGPGSDEQAENKVKSDRPNKPGILNLAAENFLPSEGAVRPLTIRLSEVEDGVWARLNAVRADVVRFELEQLISDEPELLHGLEESATAPLAAAQRVPTPRVPDPTQSLVGAPGTFTSSNNKTATGGVHSTPPQPLATTSTRRPRFTEAALSVLRDVYMDRKKSYFSSLLSRVPARAFLRSRVSPPPPQELVEATTDKWAPRPYPISTKPLYMPYADDEGDEAGPREIELSPEPKGKKRKAAEETVTFEMPVSLDSLDERVEEGAKRAIGRRGRGGRVSFARARNSATAMEGAEEGRKKKGKRGTEKGTCEGCAREGIKVWRRGPGGRGTLCNQCGDLFVAGKLGPLKAPGAMKAFNGEGDDADPAPTGGEDRKPEIEGTPAPEVDPPMGDCIVLDVPPGSVPKEASTTVAPEEQVAADGQGQAPSSEVEARTTLSPAHAAPAQGAAAAEQTAGDITMEESAEPSENDKVSSHLTGNATPTGTGAPEISRVESGPGIGVDEGVEDGPLGP